MRSPSHQFCDVRTGVRRYWNYRRRSQRLRPHDRAGVEHAGAGGRRSGCRSIRAAVAAESYSQAGAEICRVVAARRAKSRKNHRDGIGGSSPGAGVVVEARSQKPEARSQKPEARSQKPEARSQKPEYRIARDPILASGFWLLGFWLLLKATTRSALEGTSARGNPPAKAQT